MTTQQTVQNDSSILDQSLYRFRNLLTSLFVLTLFLLPHMAIAQFGPPVADNDYDASNEFLFLTDEITYINITMDPAALQAILDDPHSDVYQTCSVQWINSKINETIDDVGIRARGNVARDNKKFPWKLSFNEFISGTKFHGLEKVNLGSDAGDPTLDRSHTMFRVYREMGVPAPRTHHVYYTINDGSQIEGVYVHLEQVDEEFVQAWFGEKDGDLYKCRNKGGGKADLLYHDPGTPDVYRDLGNGEVYEEKINDENFIALAEFIDFVNNSDDETFRTEIGDRLNVDGFLRAQAVDMVCGNWDGYWFAANNFYLFQNTESGNRFEYIPWDLDNSYGSDFFIFPLLFGTNWVTRDFYGWGKGGFGSTHNAIPPLMRRVLQIQEYDNALRRHCQDIVNGPFGLAENNAQLDATKELLGPVAFMGSFSGSSMDWNYTNASFHAGFDNPNTYNALHIPMTWGLRPFIRNRVEYVRNNYPKPQLPSRVFINEIVASNDTIISDEAGEFEDYVEIYNDEVTDVDLTGWYLSDYASDMKMWEIPAGTIVPAKGFILIWCDKDEDDGPLHTNFKLSGDGEGVWLYGSDDVLNPMIDYMTYPELADDEAFGRVPDGSDAATVLAVASPAISNVGDLTEPVLFIDGGCPGEISIYISGATPGGTVALLVADNVGSYVIGQGDICVGTELGLDSSVRVVVMLQVDELGTAVAVGPMAESLCGAAYIQAVDLDTCMPTQVIAR